MADTPFSNLSIGLKYFNHLQVTRWVLIRGGAIVHSRAKLSPISSALLRSQNRLCQCPSFISLSLFAELTPRFSSTTQDHDEDFSQRQFVLISAGSQLCGRHCNLRFSGSQCVGSRQFGLMLDTAVATCLCQTSTFINVIEGEHGRHSHFLCFQIWSTST
jgi:hypothetical protein